MTTETFLQSKAPKWLMASGILTIIVGVMALIGPFFFGLAATVFIGATLMFFGIVHTVNAIKNHKQLGFGLSLFSGVVAFFAGAFLWFEPMAGLVTFGAFITIYFFISGIIRMTMSLEFKPTKGWGWIFLNGLITTFLAVFLFTQLPLSALWLPGVILGIDLVFFGLAQIAFSKQVKEY